MYRDWKARTQLSHYDCTSTKENLQWNPCSDREQFIVRGIHETAKNWLK